MKNIKKEKELYIIIVVKNGNQILWVKTRNKN